MMQGKYDSKEDFFEKTLETLKLRLKDFEPADEYSPDLIWGSSNQYSISREDAPVSAFLYLVFALLKFPQGPREEKMRWIVPFKYRSINCAIAHQKFGLMLYIEDSRRATTQKVNPKEIIGKLHKSIIFLEKSILSPLAVNQMTTGNVTIANHYHRLDNMYRYFRLQAKNAYKISAPNESDDISTKLSSILNAHSSAAKNGFYNSLAMIDAFYSRLEHLLVLLLPFSNYSREKDNLVEFIGSNWTVKYKRIFGLAPESKAKIFYDTLNKVKETFRNTFAHGGFEKNGASLFFHLPGVGAVPASLTGFKNSPHFRFMPLEQINYEELCHFFDEFEKWLEDESAKFGMVYIHSGLDVALDEASLTAIHQHSGTIEIFKEWVHAESLYDDMITNVDY